MLQEGLPEDLNPAAVALTMADGTQVAGLGRACGVDQGTVLVLLAEEAIPVWMFIVCAESLCILA